MDTPESPEMDTTSLTPSRAKAAEDESTGGATVEKDNTARWVFGALGVSVSALIWWAMSYGAGVSPDSIIYLGMSR